MSQKNILFRLFPLFICVVGIIANGENMVSMGECKSPPVIYVCSEAYPGDFRRTAAGWPNRKGPSYFRTDCATTSMSYEFSKN